MSPTAHRERLQKIRQHFVEAVDYWRRRAERADEVLTDTIVRERVMAQHRASEADEAESIAALDFALACLDAQQWQPIEKVPPTCTHYLITDGKGEYHVAYWAMPHAQRMHWTNYVPNKQGFAPKFWRPLNSPALPEISHE